jgi:hypothetical protein
VVAKLGPDEKIPASERFSSASLRVLRAAAGRAGAGVRRAVADRLARLRPEILRLLGLGDDDERSSASSTSARRSSKRPNAIAPIQAALLSDWTPA